MSVVEIIGKLDEHGNLVSDSWQIGCRNVTQAVRYLVGLEPDRRPQISAELRRIADYYERQR